MQHVSRSTVRYTGGVILAIAIPVLLSLFFSQIIEGVLQGSGEFPWWVVQFGTIGETVAAYSLFLSALSSLVVPLLTFYLGYRYGTRHTNPSSNR